MFDAGYGKVSETEMRPKHYDCPSCKQAFCLKCNAVASDFGPGHAPFDCAEYAEQLAKDKSVQKRHDAKTKKSDADRKFEKLMEREAAAGATKPCPGCGEGITHIEGCDHHQCPLCRALFCWNCGSTSYRSFTCTSSL